MRLALAVGVGLMSLGLTAAPAFALTCLFLPFRSPGERFGTKELVAHVEVLEVRNGRSMDVRILRVFHGREDRPIVTVDTASVTSWNMPRHWGFEPFDAGTQWIIAFVPAKEGRGAWQPQLCRAFLKVDHESAQGHVSDLSKRDTIAPDALGRAF
jgi:hypothetical protein